MNDQTFRMTFAEEAVARNKRLVALGMPREKKRGLPGEQAMGGGGPMPEWILADRALRFLENGPQTKCQIRMACSSSKSMAGVLAQLEREGKITSVMSGKTKWYEAVK